MAGAGLFDVRLDQVALFGNVGCTRFESAQNLDEFAIARTQFKHTYLVGLTDLCEHDGEITEALQARFQHGQRHFFLGDGDVCRHRHAGAPVSFGVGQAGSSDNALSTCSKRQQGLDDGLAFGIAGGGLDLYPLSRREARRILADGVELDPDIGQVGQFDQCAITSDIADVGIARKHHAIERCDYWIRSHALVAFDDDQSLATTYLIPLLDVHRTDDAREARLDIGVAIFIQGNVSDQRYAVVDYSRAGHLYPDAGFLSDRGWNRRAAFVGSVAPVVLSTAVLGAYIDVKRVRLYNRVATCQVVALGLESKLIHFTIQTLEFDRGRDIAGVDWLVVLVDIQSELRRHAGFKDGDLNREVAIAQHPTTVRPSFVFGCRCSAMIFCGFRSLIGAATCGQQGCNNGGK